MSSWSPKDSWNWLVSDPECRTVGKYVHEPFLKPCSLPPTLYHPQPPTIPPPPPPPPPQIYFWEFQLQNETERLRTLFLPELGIKLKNLTGYTTYMISVAAFNAAGDGPRSLPTRGRTQQAGEAAGWSDPDVAAQSCSAAVRRFLLQFFQQDFKRFAIISNNNNNSINNPECFHSSDFKKEAGLRKT